jgi:hypothetical protein
MRFLPLALALLCSSFAWGDTPDISIPNPDVEIIKTVDYVQVSGTNDSGGREDFDIHNAKAIGQFVQFLTSDRYAAVPKSLKPEFKSRSSYKVLLWSKGTKVLELQVIADSILDIPGDVSYYMQSDRHSDNLMAPLLRLR